MKNTSDRPSSCLGKCIKTFLIIMGILLVLFIIIPDDDTNSDPVYQDNSIYSENNNYENSESNYTGDTTATVMLYMIGSDLESDGGCASADIEEILASDLGNNVTVVLQTGGSKYWENPQISSDTCQRFSIKNKKLNFEENVGLVSMAKSNTLSDFIKWSKNNYPADRYSLILWNHGGGTILGFGSDEYFPDDTLLLSDISKALNNGGVHMDFVGFDACLMGTIETAYMLEPYADYLIASEETEPGTGWYYTDWLKTFEKNPSISIPELGKKIISDFVDGPDSSFWADTTLAVIDLKKIPAVYEKLCTYLNNSKDLLRNRGYRQISSARSDAKAYGDGEFEQIDIIDYIEQTNIDGGSEVIAAVKDAIVYYDGAVSSSYGLAMYYPYDYPEYYETVLSDIKKIGIDNNYLSFFNDFVNILVYGQNCSTRAKSPMEKLTNYQMQEETIDYSSASWYQSDISQIYENQLETISDDELSLTEKGDLFVLKLSDDDWDKITYIEQQIFINDGEGYIDLGCDNVYEFDDDGDLIADFDYYWVALNEQIVPFYAEEEGEKSDGSWYTYGYVPAELNGETEIEILLYWDEKHPEGYVTGYRKVSENTVSLPARNLLQFKNGDKINFLCDYYTYSGEYDASYYIGETITYNDKLSISYEELEDCTAEMCLHLKDIYQNEYWTEVVEFSFE